MEVTGISVDTAHCGVVVSLVGASRSLTIVESLALTTRLSSLSLCCGSRQTCSYTNNLKENEMAQHPGKGGKQKRPDKKPKK